MQRSDDVRPTASRVKLTYDDLVLFPDDGNRHELIDGEHYVTASPNLRHQRISGNLYFLLRSRLDAHPIGQVYYAPVDVLLTRFDVVVPDLVYVSQARASDVLREANVQGVPDLVVEIGSPSTRQRDETIKRRLYEREGVSEYWVLDPELDVVRVYKRDGSRFAKPFELSADAGDVLTTPLLEGLSLPLTAIFGQTQT
jgi:Uma2 family endonuclease